jgi:hypothetical protein
VIRMNGIPWLGHLKLRAGDPGLSVLKGHMLVVDAKSCTRMTFKSESRVGHDSLLGEQTRVIWHFVGNRGP